jgi:hypothetical protein
VESIDLEGLYLALILGRDGRITWAGAPPPEAATPEAEQPEAEDAEPTRLALDSIALADIDLALRDEAGERDVSLSLSAVELGPVELVLGQGVTWSVAALRIDSSEARLRNDDESTVDVRIQASVEGLDSTGQEAGAVDLTLGLGDGEVRAEGTFDVEPLTVAIDVQWSAIELAPLMALVPPASRPQLVGGVSSGALGLRLDPPSDDGGAATIGASGHAEVATLDATVPGDTPIRAAWKSLAVDLASLAFDLGGRAPPTVRLSKLALDAPDIRVTRPPQPPEPAPEDAEPETAGETGSAPSPRIRIDEVSVLDGKLRFRDGGFDPPLETAVSGVSLRGAGLRWPEAAARHLSLVVGSLGKKPLTLDFEGSRQDGKGTLQGERMSLLAAAPYVRQNSSYVIERGTLSVDSKYELHDAGYAAPTRVVFHDLYVDGSEAGSRFQRTFGVSLEMALVLLRNAGGDVVLDLPIESDEDGADVGLTRVVADTMRRVLLNALASPLKVAGGLLGTGDRGDSFEGRAIFFLPGESEPQSLEPSSAREGSVAALLADRPDLGIRLEAVVVEDDLEQVAERLGVESVDAEDLPPDVRATLGRLAQARLERTRAEVAASLGETLEDAEERLVTVPWKGELGSGRPRVVGRLVLHTR